MKIIQNQGTKFLPNRKPPLFLKENDTVRVLIEKIGELKNTVLRET